MASSISISTRSAGPTPSSSAISPAPTSTRSTSTSTGRPGRRTAPSTRAPSVRPKKPMDMENVETVPFSARGGADTINIGDMTGTDVKQINLDLAAVPGNPAPDGAVDTITVNGTAASDVISLSLVNGSLVIDGLAGRV